jgi:hypothetical protein
MYHAICASSSGAKRTSVETTSSSSTPSPADVRRTQIAVRTACDVPESTRSMRRASSASRGLPRISSWSTTAVSAASTMSPLTARAFSRATRRT